ncbi:GAP family protein [Leifsonia sp. YIM 134122]|uniref:GAP family protein n=1 Tax=Leifsonia stereocauli TaxID=3134136 RepID=A0ABU9W4C4_9MICO
MLQVVGALLPISLAMALSSVPFLTTVILLLSPKRNSTALPYLLVYVVGMFAVAAVLSFGLASLPRRVRVGTSLGVIEIVLGLLLIALAVVELIRTRGREPASSNAMLDRVATFGVWPAVGFALLLNVRPKALLLATAAGIAIGTAHLSPSEGLACLLLYTLLSSVTVSVPVIMTLARQEKMADRLVRMRDYILAKSGVITFIVLLMVGVVILGAGLTNL